MDLEQLKAPIGRFEEPAEITPEHISRWIESIETFPKKVIQLVDGLEEELNLTYRPGSWTVAQLVHHCADSHLNSIIRFKWTLTEDQPTIKPYDENGWITLEDAQGNDLTDSIDLIVALHKKWTTLLKSLSQDQLQKVFFHPDETEPITLAANIGRYAWHCDHHYAQMKQAIELKGQF